MLPVGPKHKYHIFISYRWFVDGRRPPYCNSGKEKMSLLPNDCLLYKLCHDRLISRSLTSDARLIGWIDRILDSVAGRILHPSHPVTEL